ncbi:MAG: hypothetical protein WCT12_30870, partial [Verrucomicrobiota bacterium]
TKYRRISRTSNCCARRITLSKALRSSFTAGLTFHRLRDLAGNLTSGWPDFSSRLLVSANSLSRSWLYQEYIHFVGAGQGNVGGIAVGDDISD